MVGRPLEGWPHTLTPELAHATLQMHHRHLSPEQRDALFDTCWAVDAVDEALAWAYFERSDCRSLLLDSGESVDMVRLERAVADLDEPALDALFRDRPTLLASAIQSVNLPPAFLIQRQPTELLRARAWDALRRATPAHPGTSRCAWQRWPTPKCTVATTHPPPVRPRYWDPRLA